MRESQLGAQFGIGHLPHQVRAGELGQLFRHRRIGAEIRRLVGLECRVPHLESFGGITLEELLLVGCEGFVIPWAHPDRGPLKHRQMRRVPRDLRHVLDGAGACSDGRDPFTRSRFRVIPARRVEPAAAESLSAGNVGDVGDIEHAHRGDDDVELSRDTVLGLELPAALGVRPPQGRDAGARDEVAAEVIVGGDLLQVGEDLRLVGEGLAPSRVQRERIGVEVRWHIACGAGIGVVAPGAAKPLTAVEDREVVSAIGELNPHSDAARACADDRDLGFGTRHLCNHYIYSVMRNGAFFGRS